MMADAMIQIHAQHKANKLYADTSTIMHKPRVSLQQKNSSNSNLMKEIRQIKRGNSFIVGQKLRESKWFKRNEEKIVCAVVETGFIIEKQEEDKENSFGIVVWVPGYEKSKDPHYLTVYTLNGPKEKLKLLAVNLSEFWTGNAEIRINNKNDRLDTPNDEIAIRVQIKNAEKRRFHNTEHFVYFCRYERPAQTRTKKITDMKWSPSGILAKFRTLTIK